MVHISNFRLKPLWQVIILITLCVFLISCSSGKYNPTAPDSSQMQLPKYQQEFVNSKFEYPVEIDLTSNDRSAAYAGLNIRVTNLHYNIGEGWANFDVSIVNSGVPVFDVFLNLESMTSQYGIVIDSNITAELKFGIIVRGVETTKRHLEITFPPDTVPILTATMTGKTEPMFRNERTLLHTDRFADHPHCFSDFSGPIVGDQVLLRFNEGLSFSEQYSVLDQHRLIPVGVNLSTGFIQCDILNGRHPDVVVDELNTNRAINHAEINSLTFLTHFPDDPIFDPSNSDWWEGGINSWGQRRIQAPEAWDFYSDRTVDGIGHVDLAYESNAPILLFILDTGYKYHEDFNIDSVDEEFLEMSYNIVDPETFPYDGHGHGVLISGIAMAMGNNQIGMAGLAWNSRMIHIKTNDDAGMGDEFRSGIAVSYAKEIALDYPEYRCVGNMSYGTHSQMPDIDRVSEEAAFIDAWPVENLQFVAAAGNCNNSANPDPSSSCHYPFKLTADNHYPCGFPQVISVAASHHATTNGLDRAASFTNFGSTVDVSAPGVDIFSTWVSNPSSYRRASGTSCSSPMVAGLFALIWSQNPSLTKVEIRNIIKASAEPMHLSDRRKNKMGTGRINAFKALFDANYLRPPVGEKVSSGDIDGDGIDETAIGINGSRRNTGFLLVFDSFGNELTKWQLRFGLDQMVTDTVFGDISGNGRDEIVVSILTDAAGMFRDGGGANAVSIRYVKYENKTFTIVPLYVFEPGFATEHITVGDVTGDGRQEVIIALQHNPSGYFAGDTVVNHLSLEIIDGDKNHLASIPIGDDKLATSLVTGDIDGDGRDEIILAYIDSPAGVFAIDGGTNTGKLAIFDDAVAGYATIENGYSPQSDRIIENVLAVNLDDDPMKEIVVSTLDYPSGYLKNYVIQNDVSLIAYDDAVSGVNEIARVEFYDNRMTSQLTEGNIHPGYDDRFWAWFMLDPIGVDYTDGDPGGRLLMMPYGVEDGEIVQRGRSASSANGYRHFSGAVRNGVFNYPEPERNQTALYAIRGGRHLAERFFEYHDSADGGLYITWEYRFPPYANYFESYKAGLLPESHEINDP